MTPRVIGEDDDDCWGPDCHVCGGRGQYDLGRWVPALVAEVRRLRDLCDAAEAMYDAYARVYVDPRFIHMHALFDAVRAFREADRG